MEARFVDKLTIEGLGAMGDAWRGAVTDAVPGRRGFDPL